MHFLSATEQLKELCRRKISALELLDLHLARVDKLNPTYNAVVALDIEGARKTASILDEKRARGESIGLLAGLPMTIKDAFEVAGMTASCGLPLLANHRPERDADSVARLRGAGAVIFGKTNLPAGATDWQSFNSLYGLTRNPWNPERAAGGSSGGSTAAIAAGFSPLELGSDIGGSIRVPSHFCGVFGHKPSYGIVPCRGHIPPMPGALSEVPLGVMGPIARSAADLTLALGVLAGANEISRTGWQIALPPARHGRLENFRVAYWSGGAAYPVDGSYRQALDTFVADLRHAGANIVNAKPPIDPADAYDLYLNCLFALEGSMKPAEAEIFEGLAANDDTGYASWFARYMRTSLHDWFGLNERREHLFRVWRQFFCAFDVFLCPAASVVAFPHMTEGRGVHSDQLARRLSVNGQPIPYFDNFMWPSIATNANLPATVMPTGNLVGGLPAGIQIIGPYLEDRTTLRFAELAEQALGGFMPPPALDV